MMSKEAMKLALEALEYIEHNYMSLPAPAEKAITALREALAQQPAPVAKPHEQEPVQNNPLDCNVYLGSGKDHAIKHHVSYGPAQRTWVGLTDKEIGVLWFEANDQDNSMIKHFARAIEAKLKEKNT